jgi:hypothetical protein
MNPRTLILSIDNLSCDIIVPQNGKVNDCFPLASMIRGSKTQRGSGYTINLLEDIDMLTQFFSASRHLGFEDIQAMVDLVADPRQILSLLIGSSLNNLLIYFLFELNNIGFLSCNPLASTGAAIQSVETQAILRCNEATTLATNEVSFNSFPVNVQSLGHEPIL